MKPNTNLQYVQLEQERTLRLSTAGFLIHQRLLVISKCCIMRCCRVYYVR